MTCNLKKSTTVSLLVALGLFVGTAPTLADPVVIEETPKDGFARIKFIWPSPVPFIAKIADRQLKVSFARPIDSNFESLPGKLIDYIGRPQLSNGGTTLTLPTKNDYGLNFNSRGRVVTIDLVDLKSPPSPRSRTVPIAKSIEKVEIRTGQHSDYGRLVFDWKKKVPYTLLRRGNRATLKFGRAANINVSNFKKRPINNVDSFHSEIQGDKTIVKFKLPIKSRLRDFSSGSKVVVDILSVRGKDNTVVGSKISTLSQPQASKEVVERVGFVGGQSAKRPLLISPSIRNQANTPLPKTSSLINAGLGVPTTFKLGKTSTKSGRPHISLGISRAKAQTAAPKVLSPAGPDGGNEIVTVRLGWDEPVAAAVFRRAGALWIVFDKAKRFDVEKIKEQAKKAVLSLDQVSAPRGTFLRLSTSPGMNPSIRRDGYAWVLDFKKQPMAAQTPIEAKLQRTSASGPRIFLPMVQAGEALPFHDASIGDNLVIVPIIPLSNGINKRHSYPEVRILPTLQGFVIQPRIDDVMVRSTSKGVQIHSGSKLSLSPPDPRAETKSRIRTLSAMKRIFKSDVWRLARLEGMKEFNQTRQEMMAQIANSRGNAKQNARIVLAQYLFGQNFGYETLGVLRRIRNANPSIESSAGFRLLRGGSKFLIRRYEEADKDLGHPSLNESDEGQFWRAINQAGRGALVAASGALKATGKIILSYPKRIKIPLGLLIAEAAVRAGDVEFATNYLQMISEDEPTPKEVDQLALVEGKLQQLVGEFDAAVEAWGSAAEGEHRPSVVQAIFRKVDLDLSRKVIKAKEAIEELERIRFSWRGDDIELKILRKLGRLYFEVEDYRNGLRTLRSAASHFGAHPDAPKIAEEMSGAFVDLYLKDVADSMSAVKAISLYEEFKELTPAGEQGNVMIQKLADRLAQVDLLEKAAKLLTLQVEFRLQGEEKARVGARLATIRLLNKQPGLAADAITNSDEKDIPPFLESQRRLLLARSYIDQGLENKALGVLDADNSRYADLLRTEVYWKAQAWPQASRALQRLIKAIGAQPNQKLNERQALFVVNQAVAMALGGNERGTAKLVRDFGAAMGKTSFKDAFRLIASPDATGLVDFRSVADKVTTVSNFDKFMASYEKNSKDGKLSKIN